MTNDQTTPLDTMIPLVGWGSYDALESSIVPRIFGHMVRLATPVMKEFHSDLYHDALGLTQTLRYGLNQMETATSFYFCVRPSGTWVGDMAITGMQPSVRQTGSVLYRIEVSCDERQAWSIEITDVTSGAVELYEVMLASR